MKPHKKTVLLLALATVIACKSYPELKSRLRENSSVSVIYKGAKEITISKNLSGVWLDEYLAKSEKGPIPADYLRINNIVAEEFQNAYPSATVAVASASSDLIIEIDLVAYYAATQATGDCSLTLRTGLTFKDAKTGQQMRWIPKLVETRKSAKYPTQKLQYATLKSVLPADEFAKAFLEENRVQVRNLLRDIAASR